MKLALVDAFTQTPGAGNRAGVVLDAPVLPADRMLAIAAAVGASETAFLLAPPSRGEVRLRYFAPLAEIPFCGHATVATFHRMVERGLISAPGAYTLRCAGGKVAVEVDAGRRIWIATPQHPWAPSPLPTPELWRLLGGRPEMADPSLPALHSGDDLFLPCRSREDLWALNPLFPELASHGKAAGVLGVFAFTRDAQDKANIAQARYFGPAVGIREDPATGAANGPFVTYLVQQGVLQLPSTGGTVRARVEQGDAMGKPSRVELEATGAPGKLERARIGGVAITVMEAELKV